MARLFLRDYELTIWPKTDLAETGSFRPVVVSSSVWRKHHEPNPVVGAESFEMRVTFEVSITWENVWSIADIKIWNPTQALVERLKGQGGEVKLNAGYREAIGTIFQGLFINVFLGWENDGTRYVQMYCRTALDVELSSSHTTVRALRSGVPQTAVGQEWVEGSSIYSIAEQLANCFRGPGITFMPEFQNRNGPGWTRLKETIINTPMAVTNSAQGALSKLARDYGFQWTVDHGRVKLSILGEGKPEFDELIEISPETGMIGSPSLSDSLSSDGSGNTLVVKTVILPNYSIGRSFTIDSKATTFNWSNIYHLKVNPKAGKGTYVIRSLTFTGDTHGEDWWVKIGAFPPTVSVRRE
jgi:hypothetical protein